MLHVFFVLDTSTLCLVILLFLFVIRITRIWTRRLRVTSHFPTFLRSLDVKVCGTLLARRFVNGILSNSANEAEIIQGLDETVRDICKQLGRKRKQEDNGMIVYELPAEINLLPLLYVFCTEQSLFDNQMHLFHCRVTSFSSHLLCCPFSCC